MTMHEGQVEAAHDGPHEEPHLPHGSWWPVCLALAISLTGLGFIVLDTAAIRAGAPFLASGWLILVGLAALLATLVGWFREDSRWWRDNIGTGVGMPKAGILLFIGSEVFIFGALFASYFTFQRWMDHWPDNGKAFDALLVPSTLLQVGFFSLFLFSSSWTIHVAEKAIKDGDHARFTRYWGFTILLGLVFLAGQVREYYELIHKGLTLSGSGQYMTGFYMITGTHGLHVMGGLFVLFVFWVRARRGQFTRERHAGPHAAAVYWHFVDIVWIFVLLTIYILPALTGTPPPS